MNYLALCKSVVSETGTLAGGVPSFTTIVAQSGRVAKIAGWVADAWRNIQTEHSDWAWMQREFMAPALMPGTSRYTAAMLSIARLGAWRMPTSEFLPFSVFDPSIGVADEQAIEPITYDQWRKQYDRGAQSPGRPIEYAISPTLEVCVGPSPDKPYTIRGEYRLSAQNLVADTDFPELPEEFHKIIVWEAAKLLAGSDEAQFAMQFSMAEYTRLRDALDREQRPQPFIGFGGGPIA